jgi:hypothetical protein
VVALMLIFSTVTLIVFGLICLFFMGSMVYHAVAWLFFS